MPITSAKGSEVINVLRTRDPKIDAVCFVGDLFAIGAMREYYRRDWRSPKGVAIAG
jgi:DNA-binding LacI/PurR family transcriptional regulator